MTTATHGLIPLVARLSGDLSRSIRDASLAGSINDDIPSWPQPTTPIAGPVPSRYPPRWPPLAVPLQNHEQHGGVGLSSPTNTLSNSLNNNRLSNNKLSNRHFCHQGLP
jgi:hypothetical protein